MEISRKRRLFLKGTLGATTVGLAVSAGLITPSVVMAEWPASAFKAEKTDDALSSLFGSSAAENSDKIVVKAPEVAENGAVVPVSITTGLSGIEQVALISSNNARPLTSTYDFLDPALAGYISTRVKMGKSGDLIAVVKAGGKLHTAKTSVKVTMGGCGG